MFPIPWNFPFRKKDGSLSTISAEMGGVLPPATASKLGGVKVGSGLSVTSDGTLSGDNELPAYTIETAGKVLTVGDDGSLEWDEKGAGGGDSFLTYDFTKYGDRTVSGIKFSSSGAEFTSDTGVIATAVNFGNITIYLDIDSLNLEVGNNKRLLMGSNTNGLIYRSTGYWGVYANNWYMTEITDPTYFDNSKVKVYVDSNNHWHIYKNNVLVFEPNVSLPVASLNVGSGDGTGIKGAILTGLRIYAGNYTEV